MAAITFYGVLWLEGANDVIADQLRHPALPLTWIARVAVFVGPVIAYFVTKRICLGLQRKDAASAGPRRARPASSGSCPAASSSR